MTTDKLAAGGDVNEQPICALHRIFFTKRGEDCALCGTARRAGEGSQAAPPTLNIEVANLVAAVRLTVQHFKRSANSGNFLGDDEHECWTALENALKPVAAAAGSGTFAEGIEAAARKVEQVVGGNWTAKFTKTMCAEIRALAQEKREPAPAPTSETVTITMPLCEAADFIELIKKKGYEIAPAPATRKQ